MANIEITRLHGDPTRIWASAGMAQRFGDIRGLWAAWMERRRFRADLKRLLKVGPHMIADLGLTLDAAMAESEKPFWQP
jgi:uncharacterized protein YjiS (DUF1127 family)